MQGVLKVVHQHGVFSINHAVEEEDEVSQNRVWQVVGNRDLQGLEAAEGFVVSFSVSFTNTSKLL